VFEGLLVPFDFADVVDFEVHCVVLAVMNLEYSYMIGDLPHFLLWRLNAGMVAGNAYISGSGGGVSASRMLESIRASCVSLMELYSRLKEASLECSCL
jgi:hypothetical protein